MEIKKVCIVGMGTMGSQIGIVSAGGGYKTSMVDTSEEKVAAGLRTVHFFLENRVKKEKLGREKMDEILDLITAEIDMAKACRDADLVIEAVHENIDAKKAVFERLDALCKPETIFASNTSTLWVTEISSATMRPEKCIGLIFLSPRP